MNALSGLQNLVNSIYCTIFPGLISVAHQAVISKKGRSSDRPFSYLMCLRVFQNFANNLNRFFLNLLAMFFPEEAFAINLVRVFRA